MKVIQHDAQDGVQTGLFSVILKFYISLLGAITTIITVLCQTSDRVTWKQLKTATLSVKVTKSTDSYKISKKSWVSLFDKEIWCQLLNHLNLLTNLIIKVYLKYHIKSNQVTNNLEVSCLRHSLTSKDYITESVVINKVATNILKISPWGSLWDKITHRGKLFQISLCLCCQKKVMFDKNEAAFWQRFTRKCMISA